MMNLNSSILLPHSFSSCSVGKIDLYVAGIDYGVKVNPSTPRSKSQDISEARAQVEGSGLTLSGAIYLSSTDKVWRRRMG